MSHDNSNEASDCTWSFDFKASLDGKIAEMKGDSGGWTLSIKNGSLLLYGSNDRAKFSLDMEDTASLTDDTWHSFAMSSTPAGSKYYLDGYQCFSSTADLRPNAIHGASLASYIPDAGIELRNEQTFDEELPSTRILSIAMQPEPLIEFAAANLSAYDVKEVSELKSGSIFLRYRVRGPGQHGTLMAASGNNREQLNLSITDKGLEYRVHGKRGEWRSFIAEGRWDLGKWHDVVVRTGHGAIQIYVDGFLEAHLPGQAFFSDVEGCDKIVIGQDTSGSRLFGEVRNAAIFGHVLNDSQIKRLSSVKPLETQCLFDAGYRDSVSYRIPSLLTTSSGVVIAGADQRETIANDSPNSINFVTRRSFDGGLTWSDLTRVVSYPGHGASGASVIDSCMVQDKSSGRIIVLIDHFPGGIGQPNAVAGIGITEDGHYILHDSDGETYFVKENGEVLDAAGKTTDFKIAENGDVTVPKSGKECPAGNIFLAEGEDPNQSLLTERTCFLQMIYSDDDGETWSKPINLNHQVKKEWMSFLGTAPGNGIQLKNSAHRGRLLIPVYFNGDIKTNFSAAVVYSDDGGTTWKLSHSPNDGRIFEGRQIDSRTLDTEAAATHESTLIERQDGSVLMLMRNQHPSGKVATCTSRDGGESWSEVSFDAALTEIFCQPNAINWATKDCTERVVFANAAQLRPYRGRGVLRMSEDGGRHWIASRTFNPAHYVYQCMSVLPDGKLGLLWERETQGLYFTKIPLSWFEAAKA